MQRASAAFGLLIFVLWLAVLAIGLAYVTVWAATRRRPQWRVLDWLTEKGPQPAAQPIPVRTAEVIPFAERAKARRRLRN